MHKSKLLTEEVRNEFERRVQLKFGCHGKPWRDKVIEIDSLPLANLAEDAYVGYRLYEFMKLARPGDLLRYKRVHLIDVGEKTLLDIDKKRRAKRNYDRVESGDCVAFLELEWVYWSSDLGWQHWGADPDELGWNESRSRAFWQDHLTKLWQQTQQLQKRLRNQDDDVLIQHEIGLIDRRAHRRDFWSKSETLPPPNAVSQLRTSYVPPGLVELLCALARHPGVKSMSLPFTDYPLWRALIKEQVTRSLAEGISPNKALYLGGAEADVFAEEAADWGGEIKGPFESWSFDVFVLPKWHAWNSECAVAARSARAGCSCYGPPKCDKVFITQQDFGEFETEDRITCDGWFVYRAKDFGKN